MRKSVPFWLMAVVAILFSASSSAQQFSALIDADRNALTGCSLATPAGPVAGIEWRVTATVSGNPPQVSAVERARCVGGAFAAPVAMAAGYPVGLNNGVDGADVVEFAAALADLTGLQRDVTVHFLAENAGGADLVGGLPLTIGGIINAPIATEPAIIPTVHWLGLTVIFFAVLLLARRHRALRGMAVVLMLVGAGLVWAANFITDGQVGDWATEAPLALSPPNSSTSGDATIEIIAVWAADETGRLFFRIDVLNAENQAPVATPLSDSTLEDQAQILLLSGSDTEGATLSFAITLGPDNGSLGAITPQSATTAQVTYTPNPDFNGSDSFTFTVNDGQNDSAPATVSLTITAVNDAPGFIAQNASVFENGGAQTATVATAINTGPADEAAQTLSFEIVGNTNPGLFSAGPSIAADGILSLTPAADQSGSATLSVQLRDNGGTANGGVDVSAPQDIVVTVQGVNKIPSFTPGADVTVLEDSAPYNQPWATNLDDGDGNTQTLSFVISANTNAALFSAGPAIDGLTGNLSFTLAPDANGSAQVTLFLQDNGGTANGGIDSSAPVDLLISATAVNDAPSFAFTAPPASNEDGGAQVAQIATALSSGPADESGQTLGFAFAQTAIDATLSFSVAPSVSPSGELSYTAAPDAFGTASFDLSLADNGGTADGGADTSAVQAVQIVVQAVNDAPSFTAANPPASDEDAGAITVPGWVTGFNPGNNEAGQVVQDFVVTVTANPALFSVAPAVSAAGELSYTAAPDAFGVATIQVAVRDNGGTALGGVDLSVTQDFTVTVNGVNDAPVLDLNGPAAGLDFAASFTEGGGPVAIVDSAALELVDIDSAQLQNATLTPIAQAEIGILAVDVGSSGLIANFDGLTGLLTISGLAPPSVYRDVLRTATYDNLSTDPTEMTLEIDFMVVDAEGAFSLNAASFVTIQAVNTAPSFTPGADVGVLEDDPAFNQPWATALDDGDGGGQLFTFNVTNNSNPGLFSAGPAIDGTSGNLSFTLAPDANGSASITVELQDDGGTAAGGVDTSGPETFTITVTDVNDVPSFTLTPPPSVLQDAGAQSVSIGSGLSAGPPDESAQTLSFNLAQTAIGPDLSFSVAPSVAADGTLSYTAAPGARGTASFDLSISDNGGTANGGIDTSAVQSFNIVVVDVNDPPSFTPGADVLVLEDAAPVNQAWATALDDGDGGGQTLTFNVTNNSNPSLFSAGPSVDGATGNLNFTLAPDANGSAAITLELQDNGGTGNGGDDTSAAHVLNIAVTAVNDTPSFSVPATAPDVLENAGAQSVPGFALPISAGPADEASQTLGFAVNVTFATGNLAFDVAPAIDATTGNLTYTTTADTSGEATIEVVLSDNGGTANGGVDTSAAQVFTLDVLFINSAPSFTSGGDVSGVLEDSGAFNQPWATVLEDGDPGVVQTLNFNVTGNTDPSLFSAGPTIDGVTGNLGFTPAADAFGSATITVVLQDNGGTANGGVDSSGPVNFVITLDPVNDAPSFDAPASAPASNEDAGAQTVVGFASNALVGPPNELSQSLLGYSLSFSGDATLTFSSAPAIALNGTLTYTAAPNAFGTGTVTATLQDDGGTASGGVDSFSRNFTLTVTGVNDAPTVLAGGTLNYTENDPATAIDPGLLVTDFDSTTLAGATVQITGNYQNGQDVLSFVNTPNISGVWDSISGTLSLSGADTVANYEAAMRAVRYANTSEAPSALNRTATWIANDGGALNNFSSAVTSTITVTPVNDLPVLTTNPIAYATAGNTQLHVAGATIAGLVALSDADSALTKAAPTDVDGPVALSVVPASGASVSGGDFQIFADGSFTYVPAAGFSGVDSFAYQVTDSVDPVAATVQITVSEVVWYVRDVIDANNPAAADTGRSNNAFESLADVQAAAGDGHIIFVYRGNTGTTALAGGITLRNGQKLHGEGIGLTHPTHGLLVAVGTRPHITHIAGNAVTVLANTVNGARSGVEIRGLQLSGSANAIDVTSADAALLGVRISENAITAAGVEGIDINIGSSSLTQTLAVHDNSLLSTGSALDVSRTAGTLTITNFANNSVSGNSAGSGLVVTGPNVVFDATPGGAFDTVSGGALVIGASGVGNGVGASGLVLNQVAGDLSFASVNVFADAGSGVTVAGTGQFTGAAGMRLQNLAPNTGVVQAAGGPAVSLNNLTADLRLATISSSGSPTNGVNLVTVLDGTTTAQFAAAAGSSISTATGTAFNVDGGNATIVYGGTIANTAGRSLAIANRTADSATFTGAITDSGTGVLLNANNVAHATSLSGGLALTTTTNAGFTATGGGTVTVLGATNTVTTTTGTAVNVNATTIGAGGMTFQSINSVTASANPAIVLNNTAAGAFSVTGTGAAGSGGTISSKTVDAVQLNTTGGLVTLNQMIIQDIGNMGGVSNTVSGHDAIQGLNVNGGLTLTGTTIRRISDNAIHGGDHLDPAASTVWTGLTLNGVTIEDTNRYHVASRGDANNEGSVRIVGLRGTATVSSSTFRRGAEFLDLFVTAGTLNMDVTGTVFQHSYREFTAGDNSPIASVGNHCIDVVVQGAGAANVTIGDRAVPVEGNSFLNCRIGSVRVVNDNPSTGTSTFIVARNTFTVNDGSSGVFCNPACQSADFDFAMGGVLGWNLGTGTVNTVIENNTFTDVTNASGGVGQLTLITEGGGLHQSLVQGNSFVRPGNAPMWVLSRNVAGSNMRLRAINNTVTGGPSLCTTDVACAGGYQTPGLRTLFDSSGATIMDLTLDGNQFAGHDQGFDPGETIEVRSLAPGVNQVCTNLTNNQADDGYSLEPIVGGINTVGAGTCPIGSPSANCQTVLGNRNNRGGANNLLTNPPFVRVVGNAVSVVGAACAVPTGGPF